MRRALPLLILLLLQPLWVLWPLPLVWRSALLAAPDQEAATHSWGLWAALHEGHAIAWHTRLLAWPVGADFALIDPGNLPWFALGLPFGLAAAYNMVLYGGILVAGIAGALGARRLGAPAWLGALLAGATPTLVANAADGMTEGFGVGWVLLQLILLLSWTERGGAWRAVLAAAALAACAWTGPYNGVWAMGIDLIVGAWLLVRSRGRALPRLVGVAILALLMTTPVIDAVLHHRGDELPGSAARSGLPPLVENPQIFRGGMQTGADLLDAWLPGPLTGAEAPISHTTYLGLGLALAALMGLVGERRRWPWAAGAAAFLLLAWGPWLTLGGSALRVGGSPLLGPAGILVHLIPPLGRITRWYRAGAVAGLLLAPLGALGIARIRSGPARVGLAIAVLLDSFLLAPHAWPLHHSPLPVAPPALPAEGAVLELPPVTTAQPPPGAWRDQLGLSQPQHGHPVGGGMMGILPSPAARTSQRRIEDLMREGILSVEGQKIVSDAGFRWLFLWPRYRGLPEPALRHLSSCFGPPTQEDRELVVFDLGAPGTPRAACGPEAASDPENPSPGL